MPPALFTTEVEGYAAFFASEMALVLVAALGFTALTARSRGRYGLLPAAVFVAAALLLYPVAVTRYDAVVALVLAATVALVAVSSSERTRGGTVALAAAWASLGFGAAAKLVPALVTLPLALLTGQRRGARTLGEMARGSAGGFAIFFCVAAAFFLPAYLLGGEGFVAGFAYHAERGLQLESLPASVLMQLGWVEGVFFEYGAFEVQSWGAEFLASMSLPVTGVLLVVTTVVMLREHRKGRFGPEEFPRFAAAFVLVFMLGSKVLSPQYLIWLLPLVPLSAGGAWGLVASGFFLAICWTTTRIYPYRYDELIDLQAPATELLLGRNLLLVVLWTLMLSLSSGKGTVRRLSTGSGGPA